MPIPFLAGFAIGCAVLYAYNNRDKIKEGASKIANSKSVEELKNSVKESVEKLSKKSKEILKDAKESLNLDGAEAEEVKKTRKKPGPKPGSKKTAAASASKTAASKSAAVGKTRKKPGPKPGSKKAKNTTSSASGSATKQAGAVKAASISIPQVVSPNDNFNVSSSADKSQK